MRYVKLTLSYMWHNALYLLMFSLIPALLLGLLTNPANGADFLRDFSMLNEFSDIFGSISELNWKSALIAIAVIPVILIFLSAMCGCISRHMRRGRYGFDKFFRRVNNNILYAFIILISLIIALQLVALFSSAFTIMWIKFFGNGRVGMALSAVTLIVLWGIFLMIASLCVVWLPTMTITGLNPIKALAESMRSSKGNYWKLFIAVLLPLVPYFGVAIPLSFFEVTARQLVFVVLNLLLLPYYITLMYTAYCDINDIDREDLKIHKFKRNGVVDNIEEDDGYDA